MRKNKLRLGLFFPPFHALNEDPTLCLERDLEITRFCDEIGLSEVWYGEHHSGGYEIIMSPELMIAAAAQITKRINLGTGVITLPYHNPLTVANRLCQLDHMTRGRLLFGAGPGLLPADAHMIGIDPRESRDKLDQGLSVITRLLRGEWVTEESSWYDLREAHCHLLPYNGPGSLPVGVASAFSPSGGTLAAKYNAALLCLAATAPGGYDALASNWKIACDAAKKYGHTMDPSVVRCATDMHIAETRDQAMDQARKGFAITNKYFENQTGHIANEGNNIEDLIERHEIVVGTPDDAVAQIRRLEDKVPDFGTLLLFDKNWTNTENKKRSLEMMMRYVLPEINGTNASRQKSFDWQGEHREEYFQTFQQATERAFKKHAAETAK